MRRLIRSAALVLGLLLVVAACGDDDDDTAASNPPAASTTVASTTASPGGASGTSTTTAGTSTAGSDIGGGTAPGSADDFCAIVRQTAGEATGTSTGSTVDNGDIRQLFDRLQAAAPAELADDFATVQRALDEIGDLDQARPADIQRALGAAPDLLGAVGAITDYAHDHCNVDLDFVQQVFGPLGGSAATTTT